MKLIERVSKEVTKYFKTWEMLLFRCDQFAALPLEQRKKNFTRPLAFLFVSLVLLYLGESLVGYWLATLMNLDDSLSLRTAVSHIPGKASLISPLVGVGLQALLWYSVVHKWLGHRIAVRTPSPFRRIFNELLYINTPITVIMMAWFLGGIIIVGQIVFNILLPNVRVIRDLPQPLANLILLPFLGLVVVLLFGGFVIPGAYYNTIVMQRLLKLERSRAVVLSVLISFFAALPIWSYGLATTQTIPQFLSDREVDAVRKSRAIASAEKYYWEKHGSVVPVAEVTEYAAHLPNDDGWKIKHPNQYSRVINLADGTAEGYRFSVEVRRRAGVVYSVPETLAGMTRHVVMTEIESGTTYVKDRPGPSENPLNDSKRLVPIGLGDN